MNKIKKTLSLVLVVLMLITAVPLQSFAAVSLLPVKITGVEFANDTPISMKYVQARNYNGVADLDKGYPFFYGMDYDLYIHFSDGDKVLLSEIFDKRDDVRSCSDSITVNYDECYNAILCEEEAVNVYVDVSFTIGKRTVGYECTLQKEIVPYIVKNMKPVTALPGKIYRDMEPMDVYGDVMFEVEYYGGEKEVIGCGYEKDEVLPPHNNSFISKFDLFTYMDESYYYEDYESLDPLYTAVSVDDCKFADNRLKEVTFTLTKEDGTTEQYIKTVDLDVDDDTPDLGKINGYTINLYYGNWWSEFSSDDEFTVEITVGENYGDATFEPEDVCECEICHYKGIKYIYYRIISAIWKVFKVNEYCACGSCHW